MSDIQLIEYKLNMVQVGSNDIIKVNYCVAVFLISSCTQVINILSE